MRNIFLCFFMLILFSACNNQLNRKVLVFYNGDATISQNNILNKTNLLFSSKEIDLSAFRSVETIEVEKDGKKYSIPLPKEKGFYVLNISNDTVYGARKPLQPVIIDSSDISQSKNLADSLQQMLEGKNIDVLKQNYRLLPDEITLISSNVDAVRAFAPYKVMDGMIEGTDDGSDPEVYKFNTTEEVIFELENYRNIFMPVARKEK